MRCGERGFLSFVPECTVVRIFRLNVIDTGKETKEIEIIDFGVITIDPFLLTGKAVSESYKLGECPQVVKNVICACISIVILVYGMLQGDLLNQNQCVYCRDINGRKAFFSTVYTLKDIINDVSEVSLLLRVLNYIITIGLCDKAVVEIKEIERIDFRKITKES